MIELRDVHKKKGGRLILEGISMSAEDGRVTAFVGPNGAGKTTTLRLIVGIDQPNAGTCTVQGRPAVLARSPLTTLGAVVDEAGVHPSWSTKRHLRVLAATHRLDRREVDRVIELCDLGRFLSKPGRALSLGMTRRLTLAMALLGDPQNIVLDEPFNGLDPEGIVWMRGLLRTSAAAGKAVLVSSHLLSEIHNYADDLVLIQEGQIKSSGAVTALMCMERHRVVVSATDQDRMGQALRMRGFEFWSVDAQGTAWCVQGSTGSDIGALAHDEGLVLTELRTVRASLEEVYFELTRVGA